MPSPTDERAFVREVAGEIETLRLKRREQWRERPHPDGKRFTQEELVSEVYGAYKHLVAGRTLRIPSRSDMLRIADWLECTIHETNDLLLAAQYLPEVVELRDDEYRATLERAQILLHLLPLPAMLYGRGLTIEGANSYALGLNNMTSLAEIAPAQRTGIHWFFDPSLPSYHVHAVDEATWRANARGLIAVFRAMYDPFRREQWYNMLLSRYQALPLVREHWDIVSKDVQRADSAETVTTSPVLSTLIREESRVIRLSSAADSPVISFGIPLDAGARYTYEHVGCSITENRWEHLLREGDGV